MTETNLLRRALRAPALVHIVLATLVLLAVAAANGRPPVFPDTAYYFSQGRYLADRVGLAGAGDLAAARNDPTAVMASAPGAPPRESEGVSGARWPIYGAVLYGAHRLGSLWALAAMQAGLCAALLWLLVRAVLGQRAPGIFHGTVDALAIGSSLPMFAAFAMPDVFAGLGVVAAALLLIYPDRLSRAEQAGVAGVSVLAAALHPTHLLLAGAMAVLAIAALILPSPRRAMGLRPLGLLALAGLAGLAAFAAQAGLRQSLGHELGAPPFLAARVLADGPGRMLLKQACTSDQAPYALCRFRALPLNDAEEVLWSKVPGRGVYSLSNRATQRRIESEQLGFVFAAVARDPAAELGAALANWGRQLLRFDVEEPLRNPADFLTHPDMARTAVPSLVLDMAPCRTDPAACKARLPYGLLRWWHTVALLASVSFIGWRLSKPDARRLLGDPDAGASLRRLLGAMAFIAAAVLVNAAVCGMISGPFPRYEARLIWLVPLAALLLGALIGARTASLEAVRENELART